jgi:ferredoxin, 2Fe-2S
MPKVTFISSASPAGSADANVNMTFEARNGDSILDVGIDNDVPIQHACGGFCACTTCQVIVRQGAEHLSPMEEDEDERLERVAVSRTDNSRLACQAKVHGDVVVEIVNLES